jgi:enoyl-CoA hydratase
MGYETVIYEKKGNVGILTLNRPDKLNAVNPQLAKEVEEVIDEVENDDEVRVLIIAGSGRAFCVGADIREPRPEVNLLRKINVRRNFSGMGYRFYQKVEDLGKPVIAAIHGHCLGGGLELAMSCDLRIAAENAQIGDQHSRIGFIGGAGSTQRLPRLVGITRAKEMIFTGLPIDAQEAYRIGLVNKVVPPESLMGEAIGMAQILVDRPPIILKLTKMCINDGMKMDLLTALEYEQKCFTIMGFSEDSKEAARAFAEKRKPQFKGH